MRAPDAESLPAAADSILTASIGNKAMPFEQAPNYLLAPVSELGFQAWASPPQVHVCY